MNKSLHKKNSIVKNTFGYAKDGSCFYLCEDVQCDAGSVSLLTVSQILVV